jgi:hypothetical protein
MLYVHEDESSYAHMIGTSLSGSLDTGRASMYANEASWTFTAGHVRYPVTTRQSCTVAGQPK